MRTWLAAILFFPSLCLAVTVSTLNVADVAVPNQSNAALMQALPKAFGQVLVKVSGNPGVVTLPSVQNAMPNLNGLLRSYSYHQRTLDDGKTQWYARVRFDHAAVLRLLQQTGQPVWDANRPLSLVWLTINNNQTAPFVLASSASNIALSDLKEDAFRRGLPYLLPAMDLQDQRFVNTNQAIPFNNQQLIAAGQRYRVTSIIAGNISKMGPQNWQGQWLLLLNGQPFRWNNQGASMDALINQAVNNTANIMANQFAVIDNKNLQADVTLEIDGVNNLGDYAKIVAYLKSLAPVTHVTVSDMQGAKLLLSVNTLGGEQALVSALMNSKKLYALDQTNNLIYRWGRPLTP